jgi:hypothetical protein
MTFEELLLALEQHSDLIANETKTGRNTNVRVGLLGRKVADILRELGDPAKKYLSKVEEDTAQEIITFLKGSISEGLIDTAGIVARAGIVSSGVVASGLAEVEESDTEGVIVPGVTEVSESSTVTTLGSLSNVDTSADEPDAYDMVLARNRGSDRWYKKPLSDFQGKDGVIVYPTMFLNPLTGKLILQVPTNNYENRFFVENGHLIIRQ